MAKASRPEAGDSESAVARTSLLNLDRRIWAPILILAALLAGWLRMLVRTPEQVQLEGQLVSGAYIGGILGGALMPWAIALLAVYFQWLWAKSRKSKDYMREEFPVRRQLLLHRIVVFFVLLMGLETCGVAALRLGLL